MEEVARDLIAPPSEEEDSDDEDDGDDGEEGGEVKRYWSRKRQHQQIQVCHPPAF